MPTIEPIVDETPRIPKMHKSNDLVLPLPGHKGAVRSNGGNSPTNTNGGASPRNKAKAPASPRNA
jgi:hypothetical protein